MAENFRREPIRSRDYLDGSRGQPCLVNIPGACIGGTETTIPAHITDETFGRSRKADDTSIVDACFGCHDCLDGRSGPKLSREEWLFYSLRALQRTIRSRVLRGIAQIKFDAERAVTERPVKPRKPPHQRTPIKSRTEWPAGRKIQSRPITRKGDLNV